MIASAPQVVGVFTMNPALVLTEYTNINNDSCQLAHVMTGDISHQDVEKWILWFCRWVHLGFKDLRILPTFATVLIMKTKCNCESYIMCGSVQKPFTSNKTSQRRDIE